MRYGRCTPTGCAAASGDDTSRDPGPLALKVPRSGTRTSRSPRPGIVIVTFASPFTSACPLSSACTGRPPSCPISGKPSAARSSLKAFRYGLVAESMRLQPKGENFRNTFFWRQERVFSARRRRPEMRLAPVLETRRRRSHDKIARQLRAYSTDPRRGLETENGWWI